LLQYGARSGHAREVDVDLSGAVRFGLALLRVVGGDAVGFGGAAERQ
jgi:hypothetical protein